MKISHDRTGFLGYNKAMLHGISRYVFLCAVLLGCLMVPYQGYAEKVPSTDPASIRSKKDELICAKIRDKIQKSQEILKVVTTSIQMGYDACGVIKCAIRGGADVRQVLTGAVEAGSTKDVVSRCALDAGADAKEVAGILNSLAEPGVCYLLPEEPEIIVSPPVGSRDTFLSPSGF